MTLTVNLFFLISSIQVCLDFFRKLEVKEKKCQIRNGFTINMIILIDWKLSFVYKITAIFSNYWLLLTFTICSHRHVCQSTVLLEHKLNRNLQANDNLWDQSTRHQKHFRHTFSSRKTLLHSITARCQIQQSDNQQFMI